jgi:hypothetical protein
VGNPICIGSVEIARYAAKEGEVSETTHIAWIDLNAFCELVGLPVGVVIDYVRHDFESDCVRIGIISDDDNFADGIELNVSDRYGGINKV